MEQLEKRLKERCPALELRAKEPMAKHTTFRIGGPAALMALPKSVSEAKTVLRAAHELGVEPFFLGNGSNLLVADEGYVHAVEEEYSKLMLDATNFESQVSAKIEARTRKLFKI